MSPGYLFELHVTDLATFAVSSTSQPNLIPTGATSHQQRAYAEGRVGVWRLGRHCEPDSVNDGCRLSMTEFQVPVRRCFSLNTRAAEMILGAMLSLDMAHAAVGV
jgi:hypothetical protein